MTSPLLQISDAVTKPFDFEKFRDPSLRTLIIGPSGSGKTSLLTQKIYPIIKTLFHIVYIITLPKNTEIYTKMLPKNQTITETIIKNGEKTKVQTKVPRAIFKYPSSPGDIDVYIKELMKFQNSTKKRYNVLLIYDDIYSEKLKSSDEFVQQFTNFRQYNISVFFLIQTLTALFSNTILGNLSYLIFFNVNTNYFRNQVKREYIEPAINNFWAKFYAANYKTQQIKPLLSKKETEYIADLVYANNLITKPYSALIYSFQDSMLYHN